MLRAALLVLSGNAVGSLMSLARNLLVARLVSVEDYGIASTLLLAFAVVEMMSALGLQQQIVQSRHGEDAGFQAALQGFQVVRGLVAGFALVLLAGPLSHLLGVPEAAWGYRAMALMPVMMALIHFDVHRLSRSMRFGPLVLIGVVPAAASLLAVWPLAAWLGDWRTMLWALLLQWGLAALLSHLVAERPYRLRLDREVMARSLGFGWPLLLNGMLLFLVFNGDRVIIGRELGMTALGIFSMGVTLTLTPTLVLERSAQNLALPRLSRIDRSTPEGRAEALRLESLVTQAVFALALVFMVGVVMLGGPVVHVLLGERYAALPPLLALLAAVQALRVAKAAPSVMALSMGRTGNALVANLARVACLPLAWAAVAWTGELTAVLWVALAGEAVGYVVAVALVRHTAPGWLSATAWAHLGAGLLLAGALGLGLLRPPSVTPDPVVGGALGLGLGLFLWSLRDFRRWLRHGRL